MSQPTFWRRVLADGGVSSLTGGALLLAVGVLFVVLSLGDLREAVRLEPVGDTCEHWLDEPLEARWVTLTGCRLDLASASSRTWKGWSWLPDGGIDHKNLELFLPMAASDEREVPPRAVVATTDAELLSLMDELARLPVEKVEGFIDEHRAALEAHLKPAVLTGYVEPIASIASKAALKTMMAEGAVVLEQDRRPQRANAIFGAVLGVLLVLGGALRVSLRLLKQD